MSWFDEQIKQRKLNDDEMFSDSLSRLAGVVLGHPIPETRKDSVYQIDDAVYKILQYYHIKIKERTIPSKITRLEERVEYILRPYGVMTRRIVLDGKWYQDALGGMLAITKDGEVVALVPRGSVGYQYYDKTTESFIKIDKNNQDNFSNAILFYKPFPLRKLTVSDLIIYMKEQLSFEDILSVSFIALIVVLLGMIGPKMNQVLFGSVIEYGKLQVLVGIATFMISVMISQTLLSSAQTLITARISTKIDTSVYAATMMRIISLPASFFKKYSSGELSSYSKLIQTLCQTIISMLLTAGLTSIMSLVYVGQIFDFAPTLVAPAFTIILVTVAFSVISSLAQMSITEKRMKLSAKESGLTYALLSGIQKIKLAGAEKRAFAKWADEYALEVKLEYDPPMFIKLNSVFTMIIELVGAWIMYYLALKAKLSVSDYYAFNTAYGMAMGAFTTVAGMTTSLANIKPVLSMAKPIMEAEPEITEDKQIVTDLKGNIELNNITFRYEENDPVIIDDLSLLIKKGQYVAIVGKTGCGKSTLVRILLGFEKPQKGAVFYDGRDIGTLELRSLRRKIGVVTQNAKLFQGNIYDNIAISSPWITLEDAWKAAELASVAEDIRKMPMGMHTMISEGEGGISGGQKQRLMIARALAGNPQVLIFDEATSALDNITQKKVSDALNDLKCTRIVVAHRLSTIKQCDRIILLDQGKIAEDGTYEELMAKNGEFAELVKRQLVN